ncbi:MAG: hypothetical protein ACTSXD_11960 [Candidatus Heimdallarchaeaceae archaeon]
MTIASELSKDFNSVLKYGEQIRIKYYNVSYSAGSYYDDDVTLTKSGSDLWTSGLVQPLDKTTGGYDALLLQQGKITLDDKKVYINGSIQTSGTGPIKIGIGSPPDREYQIMNEGQTIQWTVNGSPIYKKVYLRFLPGGSFIGE